MQNVNAALQLQLDKGQDDPRIFVDLLEFYASSAVPGVDGFEPADAIETFAGQEITWNGIAYRREFKVRGEVSRSITERTNSASLTFSNISRYMATWAQTQPIEGMILVIRTVNPDVEDDYLVQFVGRCDKPGDIDKQQFPLAARQDFGNINQTVPFHKFIPEDPDGRLPGDLLYQGFRITTIAGTFQGVPTTTGGFLGLFKKKKANNQQFSSYDLTEYGNPVPEIFGTCQMEGKALVFQDRGNFTLGMWVWGKGPIKSITTFAVRSDGRTLLNTVHHLGDLGGTGTNATEDTLQAPGIGVLSLTAYTSAAFQSALDVVDEAPTVVSIIQGRLIDLPDGSGVFNREDWSDNPIHLSRFILTDERFVNIDPAFIEDSVNYLTSLHCDEPLIDDTNSELILIPSIEAGQAGSAFKRFQSSGLYNTGSAKYFMGDLGGSIPQPVDGPYEPYDPGDFPTSFATRRLLRKRYTCNFPITEEVRAVDLLYKTVFPSFRGFMRVNKRGKYEIRSEKASDATRLRSSTVVAATSIPVLDVTPWKLGQDLLTGRLLTGMGLITSEVRDLLSADFSTSGNGVTLVANDTGTTTATASGATLSGGSTSVQASGEIEIGGTPAAGDIISAVIDGIEASYTLSSTDTTETAAAMLAAYINATPRLKPYIKAFWVSSDPSVVTIKCLHGALNLSASTGFPTLLKTHTGPIADPGTAPTVAAASGGTLAAGTWLVAYSDVTAIGSSALTPTASVVVTVDQQIDVSGLPALVGTARNFYVSDQAGSTNLRYVTQRTNASNFSILNAPEPGAALPPSYNTTAEEVIRIAMSFATNSQDVYSAWPTSTLILLNDIYLPTVLNGHKYQVSTGGTTGATEPVWPTAAGGTVASGTAVFTEIGSTVLAQAGLKRANIIKDTFKWPLGSTQSSINQIKGNFRDRKNDFALTPFKINDRAKQLQIGGKVLPKEVDYSAVDNFHQVYRLGNGDLAKNVEGDWFNSFRTYARAMVLEEGDLICASDDSGGLVNVVTRIEDMGIGADHEVSIKKARLYSTSMFSDDVGAATIPIPSTLRYIQTVDSIAVFIDSFAIRESDALVPGFYIAVSRDLADLGDWRGWTLYADYGDGYVALPGAFGDIPAVMGTATTTLDTVTDATVFDTVSDVTFTLKYGTPSPSPDPFATVTEADLIANPYRNLFLVGGEYLQAKTVVNNGSNSFTISNFYRGRFGTGGPELTHGAGEDVVFLNGAETFVAIDPLRVGIAYNYKVVTTNQDVADATPISFTWTGGTVKPLRMSNPFVTKDASDHWLEQAEGHPRAFNQSPTYESLHGTAAYTPATDIAANTLLTLPMVTGTSQAALMAGSTGEYDPDTDTTATTSHAYKNNVGKYTSGFLGGVVGTSIQAITQQYQRFDFEMTFEDVISDGNAGDIPYDTDFGESGFGVALHERANAEAPYPIPDAADCPLSVEWSVPLAEDYWDTYPEGTVREVWKSYGSVLLVREGVDPGRNPFAMDGTEVINALGDEARSGPRYSMMVNGSEISAHQDYKVGGGFIVKVSLGDDIVFPLRLTCWTSPDSNANLRNAMFSGALHPSTILSDKNQMAAYGSIQTELHLLMREVSPYPGVKGAPLYVNVP